jgi:hypothetical protein
VRTQRLASHAAGGRELSTLQLYAQALRLGSHTGKRGPPPSDTRSPRAGRCHQRQALAPALLLQRETWEKATASEARSMGRKSFSTPGVLGCGGAWMRFACRRETPQPATQSRQLLVIERLPGNISGHDTRVLGRPFVPSSSPFPAGGRTRGGWSCLRQLESGSGLEQHRGRGSGTWWQRWGRHDRWIGWLRPRRYWRTGGRPQFEHPG